MKMHNKGFTLIELVIALTVLGILAAIGYPSYQNQVAKSRRGDAQAALMGFANAMERYYTQNNTYAGAAVGGGGVFPAEAPVDGSNKYYDLSIPTATVSAYTLRAVPKNGQAGDGRLEIDSDGTRRWNSQDNGTGTNTAW
ncbi:MAG TPA: type IV pilin protein [Gammaproteobacteria bacterium]